MILNFFCILISVAILYAPLRANSSIIATEEKKSFQHKGIVNVIDSGAKGDGITDDTIAIKKAIANSTLDNRKVFFPTGIYKVTETISLPSKIQLYGIGNGSRLIMGRSLKKGIFSGSGKTNIIISKLSLEGTNISLKKQDTERLLFFDKCSAVKICNCDLSRTIIAIQGQNCMKVRVANCHVHDILHKEDLSQGYGVLLNNSCRNIFVVMNKFKKIGRHAVYLSSGTSNGVIKGNLIEGSESSGISIYSKSNQSVTENIEIVENDIRNIDGHVSPRGISIVVWCKNITVRLNRVSNIKLYGIAVEGGAFEKMENNPSNIVIENNMIDECCSAGIWVINANNILVQKNIINAKSGIVAGIAGKLQGSYLNKFRAYNNKITYHKCGIMVDSGVRIINLIIKENIFNPRSLIECNIHVNKI